MDVTVTPLPSLGIRQDFNIHSGHRIGVITHRDGRFELIVSDCQDPDKIAVSVDLTTKETSALANLLGAPQLMAQLAGQQREVPGVTIWQLPATTTP